MARNEFPLREKKVKEKSAQDSALDSAAELTRCTNKAPTRKRAEGVDRGVTGDIICRVTICKLVLEGLRQ